MAKQSFRYSEEWLGLHLLRDLEDTATPGSSSSASSFETKMDLVLACSQGPVLGGQLKKRPRLLNKNERRGPTTVGVMAAAFTEEAVESTQAPHEATDVASEPEPSELSLLALPRLGKGLSEAGLRSYSLSHRSNLSNMQPN